VREEREEGKVIFFVFFLQKKKNKTEVLYGRKDGPTDGIGQSLAPVTVKEKEDREKKRGSSLHPLARKGRRGRKDSSEEKAKIELSPSRPR